MGRCLTALCPFILTDWEENASMKKQKLKLPKAQLLPSGKYRCQVMVDGHRVSVTADDEKTAQAKAIALQAGIEKEAEKKKKFLSLSDAIEQYIDIKRNVLSPSTVRGYYIVKNNRFKSLMKENIWDMSKRDVQKAVDLESVSCSPKTIANAYGLVASVLKSNGIDVFGIKLPQKLKSNKRYLQPDDVSKLLGAAAGDSCEIEIIMAVWLGMRRSEIIGLYWDCVDFDNGTLTVSRTCVPDENNKWIIKDGAKNVGSQRTVSCPEQIMDKLKSIKPEKASGQVFKIHPDTLRRHIHRVCEKAGITDTTVHGLRHTNAAIMKTIGVDDGAAMKRGGWKTEAVYKQTYAYVFDQKVTEADTKINDYFSKLHTNLPTKN